MVAAHGVAARRSVLNQGSDSWEECGSTPPCRHHPLRNSHITIERCIMGHHLIDGEFQSDKYPWCKRGFVPLRLTDPDAPVALSAYAKFRRDIDPEFSADLVEAIRLKEEEAKKAQNG